jgi:low affinity Fe/Cu permease
MPNANSTKRLGSSRGTIPAARKDHGFHRFARATARASGKPAAFALAISSIVIWAVLGPVFHFSDTWQLVINTATTIVTFLMVFLIQNTQNRDSEAMQLKLDELIRATKGCHNAVLDIEELSEDELDRLKTEYAQLAKKACQDLRSGASDSGTPEITPRRSEAERL